MANPNPDAHVDLIPGQAFPTEPFKETVVKYPNKSEALASVGNTTISNILTFNIASFAETVPPWGTNAVARDKKLREFWKSEDMLAGAVYGVSARNAAFEWEIVAEDKTKDAVTNMLHNAISGSTYGWIPFIQTLSQDLYTQDNGAFIELIRPDDRSDAPVIGISILDSARCFRTGNPQIPVIYVDDDGGHHKMKWWNIIPLAEFPSSEEKMKGIGLCAVSRVLRLAEVLKNIAVYKNEKVSGRFYKQIHFVGGVSRQEINDIMDRGQERADNAVQSRFILPEIIASLDPEKPVSTASIDLASLPDNFDLDTELTWYITGLAMGFGVDYQDFAPLPGGNLGTSTQSETLHRKSSGKSPKLFMETIQNAFHFYGVLPTTARFIFKDKDLATELENEKLGTERAQARAIRVRSGEITPQVARDIALRQGDLTEDEFDEIPDDFGENFMTPDLQVANGGADMIGNSQGDEIDVRKSNGISKIEAAFNEALAQTKKELAEAQKEKEEETISATLKEHEETDQKLLDLIEENKNHAGRFLSINHKLNKIADKVEEPPVPEKKEEYEETIVVTKRDSQGRMLEAQKTRAKKE